MRDAPIDLTSVGGSVFSVPAVAQVELVAEKLRASTSSTPAGTSIIESCAR